MRSESNLREGRGTEIEPGYPEEREGGEKVLVKNDEVAVEVEKELSLPNPLPLFHGFGRELSLTQSKTESTHKHSDNVMMIIKTLTETPSYEGRK